MRLKHTVLSLLAGLSLCTLTKGADREAIAVGDWSEPVANKYGLALRGRLLICEYPQHRGPGGKTEAALYVELQEYSDFVGAVGEVYWNPAAVDCTLTDPSGKPVPNSPSAYGGPVPSPCWISLPSHSSMRLRVSPYAGGRQQDGGFGIWTARFQVWTLKSDDTNTYFLSGSFTVDPPTNRVPTDFRYVWKGTLKLPKMKVGIEERKPQPSAESYDSPAAGSPAGQQAMSFDDAVRASLQQDPKYQVVLAMAKDGSVSIAGRLVAKDELKAIRSVSGLPRNPPGILIRAHRDANRSEVRAVMDALALADIRTIGVAALKEEELHNQAPEDTARKLADPQH